MSVKNKFRRDYSRRRVLGACGAAVFGGLAGCQSGDDQSPTTERETTAGTTTAAGGGDLRTYTHSEYGYSLRLPSAWSIREDVVQEGVSFSSVVSIPGEEDEIGRIYVNDVPDAHPVNNIVEEFVANSRDDWDSVETGEVEIADGRTLPVATVSTAAYLQVRWLSVLSGSTRFDIVPAVWLEALTPDLSAAIDATLRSFTPPAGPPESQRRVTAGEELRPLAVRREGVRALQGSCDTHEQRLREINEEARRLQTEQDTLKRGFDSAMDGLMAGFREASGQRLPGLRRAWELISLLCELVNGYMAGSNALRADQQSVSEQRLDAAKDLRQCREDNPDQSPGAPSASISSVTRQSITLDLENVPMDRFSLRFVTDSGDGIERLEQVGPIDAPGGQFSGTVQFGDYGFSAENKKVRMILVLIPVEGSGSDRPATAIATILDPYGDYAN